MDKNELFRFLESRIGKIKGVCVTGGEPLLWESTRNLISHIKALGFAVKLDTNGSFPERLKTIINDGDLDYIAMDIKSPLHNYAKVTNSNIKIVNPKQIQNTKSQTTSVIARSGFATKQSINPSGHSKLREESYHSASDGETSLVLNIQKSIDLIMSSGIDYEFRTTVAKPYHSPEDFIEIGKMINGAKKFYIQNFVKSKHLLNHIDFKPFSKKELGQALKNVSSYVDISAIR
jgi:pyruvate formate lyase activating enzyme